MQEPFNLNNFEEDGLTLVGKRKRKQRFNAKALLREPKAEVLYIYCHESTEKADIVNQLLVNFSTVDIVNAFRTSTKSRNQSGMFDQNGNNSAK